MAAVMLVFIAGGLYMGLLQAVIRYPRSLPGEIVVKGLGGGHAHTPRSRDFTVTSVTGCVPACRLLGVYSGRVNDESDLGMVWKLDALSELVGSIA